MDHIKEILILAVCLMLFGFSFCVLFGIFCMYQEGMREYENLQEYIQEETDPEAPNPENGDREIDVEALLECNGDFVAWISCDALGLSYPVVQGADNKYYLDHTFLGEEHRGGCIFMDCRNAPGFTDDNTILYGHNMKDGSMFGSFGRDLEGDVLLHIYTKQETLAYQAVANRIIGVSEAPYYQISFTETDLKALGETATQEAGVPFGMEDQFLTLSTCNGNDLERHIILCRKIKL